MSDLYYFNAKWIEPSDKRATADVCVYGGTSAGVAAAVATSRLGKSVIVLHPGKFVGGLTTGGLGETDYGRKHVIGGIAREFYRRVGKQYGQEEQFQFEPHVASVAFEQMLREQRADVRLCEFIDSVQTQGGRIVSISMLSGLQVKARVFIDATYEGDLMAKAGVGYHVGREDNSVFGETLNGIQVQDKHQFSRAVDPFIKPGDAGSGLLPGIVPEDLAKRQGQGDARVQAYNFRVCMTDDPALKIDWEKPQPFDPSQYVLAARWFQGPKDEYNDQLPGYPERRPDVPRKFDIFPNKTPGGYSKTDTNNHGPVSSDLIGGNYAYPEASYEQRERIFQAHVTYQKGYYWFMANSDEIPDRYRTAYARWGLPKDEFKQTGNWPHALYVREARRMIGQTVITEHEIRGTTPPTPDPIGMGSYGMDSHNCSRFVRLENGVARVLNEGDVQSHGFPPYAIPYRAITPNSKECTNLLVPVCVSASHIAYGSARMEPVFMVLGQSAATAACQAIDEGVAVQEIKYEKLRAALLDAGQILAAPGVDPKG